MKPASAELIMPEALRPLLSQPWLFYRSTLVEGPREYVGSLLRVVVRSDSTVFVGDVVCGTAIENLGPPRMCIVDSRTMRSGEVRIDERLFDYVDRCRNERGSISLECLSKEVELLRRRARALLIVDGEEDLLALPIVAMNVVDVVFGVPGKGICIVWRGVDNAVLAINTLSRFRGFEELWHGIAKLNSQHSELW